MSLKVKNTVDVVDFMSGGEGGQVFQGAINGRIQFIDTILGIPYLDMTNLICSDLWLL
jgi:hypothetical protein